MRRAFGTAMTLLAASVAACFSTPSKLFGDAAPGGTSDGQTDAHGDGPAVDTPPNIDGSPSCTVDDMTGTGTGTCGFSGWASLIQGVNGSASLSGTSGGELLLRTSGSGGSVTCKSVTHTAWSRFTFDIPVPAVGSGGKTTFGGLQSPDGSLRWGVTFSENTAGTTATTEIDFNCSGLAAGQAQGPWNSAIHYFQVVRLSNTNMEIRQSSDNATFVQAATCNVSAGTVDDLHGVVAVQSGSNSSTTTASVGFIELCP